ncbi:MAG: FAD-dependent oxidoreductase [Methanomicrobiales archaeon]|nr:FAD-dependent oxidoreductase [Methanomicrobiales archaeon]
MKTVILGGGLTGLTIARLLQEKGDDVSVLEQEKVVGGLCRSRCDSGFTFDLGGSHIIFSRDRSILEFMNRALGENLQWNQRNTKISFKGRYIKYPFENGLHQLEKDDLFFCLSEFVRTLIRSEKGEIPPPANFREWMVATFGKGIAELYLIPYNTKIWKYPPDQMSLHWVEGRIPRPPVEDILKSAIGIETEGYTHQSRFTYPLRGGIAALVAAIARPVQDRIQTGFQVSVVEKRDGRFVVRDRNGREVIADRCISTIPLHALIRALPQVPGEVQRACAALQYTSLACIYLGVRAEVPDISWLYVPEKDRGLFNRISFPSNYSALAAPPGHGAILAEITYRAGDTVAAQTDEELLRHTISSLVAMGLLREEEIAFSAVARQEYAYVIYDLAYQESISIVREYCEKEGIELRGRFSQFEYLNMDDCIRTAMECAEGSL